MAKCNHDCFNCTFDDCIVGTMTKQEREEAKQRDKDFTSYGRVIYQKPKLAKHRGRR